MPTEPRLPGIGTPYWVVIAFIPITVIAMFVILTVLVAFVSSEAIKEIATGLVFAPAVIGALFLYGDIRYVRKASHWYPRTKYWIAVLLGSPALIFGPIPVVIWYLRKRRSAVGTPQEAWVTSIRKRIRNFET